MYREKSSHVVDSADPNNIVAQTFGCGSAIASSSVATEWVKGMKVDDAIKIKNTEIANHLNLPPVKLHCSMLAEDAIKAAVKDFKAKQEKSAKASA
jgi:NifU-like protein involved in Fe-S cluster formation